MKKLGILMMAMVLVFGMSLGVMADDHGSDSTEVEIGVEEYASVHIVTEYFDVNGLFPEALSGEPGLYVSDGQATLDYATGEGQTEWEDQGLPTGLDLESSLIEPPNVNDNNVEVIMVDTNHEVDIKLEWIDQNNWPDDGLYAFFRTSTHEDIPQSDQQFIGTPSTVFEDAVASASGIDGDTNWKDNDLDAQVHANGEDDKFTVPAEQCQGPYMYHLNGGLLLEKADSVMADEDTSVTLELTVSSSE